MSTLNVSNISDGTTSVGTGYVVNGSAKAYFHGDITATIVDGQSFNISSGQDNAVGIFQYSMTNSMSSADYIGLVTVNSGGLRVTAHNASVNTSSIFGASIGTSYTALSDEPQNGVAYGDLA